MELWHGGMLWDGGPAVQPPRKGRYECGPGICLTTSYARARKFSAGRKVTMRVTVADTTRWLEKARRPVEQLLAYVREAPGLRARAAVLRDLQETAEMDGGTDMFVSCLVNFCVNRESLSGQPGVHLAAWLAEQGIDASLRRVNAEEQWVIVFNPKVITGWVVVPAAAAHGDMDVPLVTEQLKGVPR